MYSSEVFSRIGLSVRGSTFDQKRYSIRAHSSLVIASGWYEWTGVKSPRQPYYFTRGDGHTFAFAGIWTENSGEKNYAILTAAANEWTARFHHRMPLVVDPSSYDTWLSSDTSLSDFDGILSQPFDDSHFFAYPVSTSVNKPENDSPELLQPIPESQLVG